MNFARIPLLLVFPVLLTGPSTWASQTVLCAFRDLDTRDRIEVVLKTPESGTLQYLTSGGDSSGADAPLEMKRIEDNALGFAQFDVPTPNVKMTFKIPVGQVMQNGAKFRGILSSVIESMNLTQDQELVCDATLAP
ncbi:hypothetical protein EB061_05265 [bacterium]|jgi:hypothetical protein|nr:hypothetical protein [bacterium]